MARARFMTSLYTQGQSSPHGRARRTWDEGSAALLHIGHLHLSLRLLEPPIVRGGRATEHVSFREEGLSGDD
jgi:hypothetical protein